MNNDINITDQELREALHRLAQRRVPQPLPEDFADRVLKRLHGDEHPVPEHEASTRQESKAPTAPPPRRLWRWAVAASIAIAVGLTIFLWPHDHGTIYQDTFASAEEACMALGTDNNTIIL